MVAGRCPVHVSSKILQQNFSASRYNTVPAAAAAKQDQAVVVNIPGSREEAVRHTQESVALIKATELYCIRY